MNYFFQSIWPGSLEEPIMATGISLEPETKAQLHQRRHSSHHPSRSLGEHENVQVLVDRFLAKLSSRLDEAEGFGHQQIDAGINRAYSTLIAVRDACSRVVGDSKRRAEIFLETLAERYNDVLATKETMEQKIALGIRMLEDVLLEFEAGRIHLVADAANTGSFVKGNLDGAWRQIDSGMHAAIETIDEGIEKAKRAKEHIRDKIEVTVEGALKLARERGLLRYTDLPDPWRSNPHILSGYRFHSHAIDCLRSTVSINNEVFNIWSHLIGVVVVLSLAFYFYPLTTIFPVSSTLDLVVAGFFFVAACKCMACSTVWHTFNSIAHQPMMERLVCVDYTGISLLVAASAIATEYTAFYCQPVWQVTYISVTGFFGLCGAVMVWHPVFNRTELAWLRVLFFSGLAATACIPFAHLCIMRGFDWATSFYAPAVRPLLTYLCGAVLYALRFPECCWPGEFDYLGASHNIWHVAVLGGIFFSYHAMIDFFHNAFEHADPTCLAR